MALNRIYTIGHSNRSLDELLTILQSKHIATLVDVRAHPYSRRHPQFSSETLRTGVETVGMTYHWAGRQLGGKRPVREDSPHVAMEEGLRGYADYMDTEDFQQAAAQLINLAARAPTALLCAERLAEHCHRSLLADYLVLKGVQVIHLVSNEESHEHNLSSTARLESIRLIYDRNTSGTLF